MMLACAGCVVVPAARPVVANAPPPAQPECREFEQTVMIGGRPQQAYGTTCRQTDGSWRLARRPLAAPPPPPAAYYPAYASPVVLVPVGPPPEGAEHK